MDKPVLLIDNFDSFTHMLSDYILQTGVDCEVIRNDEEYLLNLDPTKYLALVISPGPETPAQAGLLMEVMPKFLEKIPVLGVCLGHQAIGMHYGAKLVHAKKPRHGKVDSHEHMGNILFEGVGSVFLATRYHSLILENLPDVLEPICFSEKEVMGLAHRNLPVFGLQFHPESCETENGLLLINNFIALAKTIAQK
jgi:anthranilate synthase component II